MRNEARRLVLMSVEDYVSSKPMLRKAVYVSAFVGVTSTAFAMAVKTSIELKS